ncbi:MAG: hypothetical protein AMXMBFR64_15990 [Myxococcales bacterium]
MSLPRHERGVFRWWTPNSDEVRLRRRELVDRIWWSVVVRWVFVALGALGTLAAATELLPVSISPILLAGVTAFLALTNVVYSLSAGPIQAGQVPWVSPRGFLLAQSTTDFVALSALTYTLGLVETPISALFLAHISLLTLHCTPRQSLTMALVGAALAATPVVLTGFGVLPPQSILGSDLAARLAEHRMLTTVYVLGLFAVFLTCWYLVAQLANGLRAREARLQADHDRLLRVGEQKVRATLRATHELKAPLAAIKSYVYTMRDGYTGELPPATRTVVLRIGERCDLLMQRIGQIIHLANLKTLEPSQLELRRLNLTPILCEEVAEAAARGQPRGVGVAWDPPATEAPITASEPELRAMLSNLLSNAVDYSLEGGRVSVSLRVDAAGVHCAIADQGIGIPAACIPRIWEDHFRTDQAVRHRPNGSGLGLAIVAEVVRLHDAQIDVKSRLGEGTTMTVTFPHPTTGGSHGAHPDDR